MPLLDSARSVKGLPAAVDPPVLLTQLPVASYWRQMAVPVLLLVPGGAVVPGVPMIGAPTQPGGSAPGAAARHWPPGPIWGQVGAAMPVRLVQLPSGARGQPGLGSCTRPPSATLTAGVAVTSTTAGADQAPLPVLPRRRACT